jgi:hypothetical protein
MDLHLALAIFWTVVTAVVFVLKLEDAVWVILLYSAYANIEASLSAREGRKAKEEAKS